MEPELRTVVDWIEWAAQRLETAGVHFGHGTDNSRDEAAWLVLYAVGAGQEAGFDDWGRRVDPASAQAIRDLVRLRIERRWPAAYLTGTAWFAGLAFEVNPEVLVPRSPIAELIVEGFEPWVRPQSIRSLLDMCTGCGCIAVACALRFPPAAVDAVDLSPAALELARRNAERHGVRQRVRFLKSDLFASLADGKYDVIVANPPYVPIGAVDALPAEYRAEPRLALVSGQDGLDVTLRILEAADEHLGEGGVLICEVGESDQRLQNLLPCVPFTWLEFSAGGAGVFLLDKAQTGEAAAMASAALKDRKNVT